MPWNDGYTICDEKTLEVVEWPKGNRCAVVIVVDYSVPSGGEGIGPKEVQGSSARFGTRIGVYRLLDMLRDYGLKATFATPAVMAEVYPDSVREIVNRGHEVAANGLLHEDVSGLSLEEEKKRLDLTTEILDRLCGVRPAGWYALPRPTDSFPAGNLSPNTVNLVIDAKYDYLGNGMADDIPHYWVTDFNTRRNMLTLPYYYHLYDQLFLDFPPNRGGTNCENDVSFLENCKQEFDAQYLIGRYFTFFINPCLISYMNRLEILENLFTHIRDVPGVWNPTAIECARYWMERYPADEFLKLEPPI